MAILEQHVQTQVTAEHQVVSGDSGQAQRTELMVNMINVCLFVPQAFLSRTPELASATKGDEDEFQTFGRDLQKVYSKYASSEKNSEQDEQLLEEASTALANLYTTIHQEIPWTTAQLLEAWDTIHGKLFEGTMARIQTQPQWVESTLTEPLTSRANQVTEKVS